MFGYMEQPTNLVPIPTQPWPERPDSLPLDIEECRTAIWRANGNITEAAQVLKVTSQRLRRFVKSSQYLQDTVAEASETLVDRAEQVVREALDDPERADPMARFILQSKGKTRGWGTGGGNVNINKPTGPLKITWADGMSMELGETDVSENATVIEHE